MQLTQGRFFENATSLAPLPEIGISGAQICARSDGPVRDIGGRVCLPGLTDAHLHIFPLAMFRLQLDVATAGITSVPDLLAALSAIPTNRRFGGWLQAAVLVEDTFAEKRLPTLEELDTAFPDTPVMLRRYCGHVAILNTAAMRALGLTQAAPKVSSGSFFRDAAGALTGKADEGAAAWVFARAPAPPDEMILSEMDVFLRDCLALGLTSLVEAAVGFTLGYDREAAIWETLRARGNVPVRLGFMNELKANEAAERGLHPQWSKDWSSETLKFFADGIIGGRTGALSHPYDDTSGTGELMQAPGVLEKDLADAHNNGWRIAVHATGDRGVDRVLSAISAAQGADQSRRHRIEHFFVPPPEGFERASAANINIVTQPGFLHRMGGSIARGLGDRVNGPVYPGASALAAKAPLTFSSDAPTGPLSPWQGMRHSIDRIGAHGGNIGPGEAVSRSAALGAYISGGAWSMRHEAFRGQLTPGMAADLVVLNMDPFTAPLDELAECACLLAVKDGEIVWDQL
ncbi:MAG: amidohydrolase [Rhodobacteraceae bacterium]|nr:amidohydrolase [Paracoccaceae bacterium]